MVSTSTAAPRYRMTGSASMHVDAPPATVWALISDVTRMGEWSPETYRAEWIRGSTGPAVGARFRGWNRRPFFQRWSTRPRVRACEPEREFTFALGLPRRDFVVWRYVLDADGSGTTVTESVTVRGWALYGLLRPRRREQQLIDGMRVTLARIKQAAEAA